MPEVKVDQERCVGCGICADFCPVSVFELAERPDGSMIANPRNQKACWSCDTCVGQCPAGAIQIIESPEEAEERGRQFQATAAALPAEERATYASWRKTLTDILGLRWNPVAITLIKAGQPMPDVPMPKVRLRYCQSLMMARRGKSVLMPAQCHACPDGTHILGLTEIPPKLASGELYVHFHKMASIEAARQMIAERPRLPDRSTLATLVAPLQSAALTPDVIAVIGTPEQIMWLCISLSYYSGHRHQFNASGFNAQCAETTLIPYVTGKPNISFGCYGCRASSDIGDEMMFMGIPRQLMPEMIKGLEELGSKAMPDSRNKIYLPPNI